MGQSSSATTFSKLGVQFRGLGYYYPSTEKNTQFYPVWCSQLHNHTMGMGIKIWIHGNGNWAVGMGGNGNTDCVPAHL